MFKLQITIITTKCRYILLYALSLVFPCLKLQAAKEEIERLKVVLKEISAADNGNKKKYEEAKQRLQQHDMVVARNRFLEEALAQANVKIEALEKENIALKAGKKTEISLGQNNKCLQTDMLNKQPRENYLGTDFKSRDEVDRYNESVSTKSGNKRRRKRGKKGARKGNVVTAQSETADSSSAKESASDDLLSEDASIGKSTCAGDKSVDAKEPCSATLIPMECDKSAIDAKESCCATLTVMESGKSIVDAKGPYSATQTPIESDKSAIGAKEPCCATLTLMESGKSTVDAKEPYSATLMPMESDKSAIDANEQACVTQATRKSGGDSNENSGSEIIKKSTSKKACQSSRHLDDKAATQRSIMLDKSCQTELGQNVGMFPEKIDWGMQGTSYPLLLQ